MALDPQAKAVIDLVIKSGRPAYHTLARRTPASLFRDTRPASTPTPPQIRRGHEHGGESPNRCDPGAFYRAGQHCRRRAAADPCLFHGGDG